MKRAPLGLPIPNVNEFVVRDFVVVASLGGRPIDIVSAGAPQKMTAETCRQWRDTIEVPETYEWWSGGRSGPVHPTILIK